MVNTNSGNGGPKFHTVADEPLPDCFRKNLGGAKVPEKKPYQQGHISKKFYVDCGDSPKRAIRNSSKSPEEDPQKNGKNPAERRNLQSRKQAIKDPRSMGGLPENAPAEIIRNAEKTVDKHRGINPGKGESFPGGYSTII